MMAIIIYKFWGCADSSIEAQAEVANISISKACSSILKNVGSHWCVRHIKNEVFIRSLDALRLHIWFMCSYSLFTIACDSRGTVGLCSVVFAVFIIIDFVEDIGHSVLLHLLILL